MKTWTPAFAAGLAAITFAIPASAQFAQERLDARYDRALAAGYKALFLCSAISHAEANGTTRTPESVHAWELTGIQAPLDSIIRDMTYEIVRRSTGQIAHVRVDWAQDMPARVAINKGTEAGCSILPIGSPEGIRPPEQSLEMPTKSKDDGPDRMVGEALLEINGKPVGISGKFSDPVDERAKRVWPVLSAAFNIGNDSGKYGEGVRTTAVLVRQLDGEGGSSFQGELYSPYHNAQTPQRTWSVAKSIAATLVGAAVQRGDVDVNASAGLGVDEDDPRRAISINQALRMATGRYSDTAGNRTDPLYWGGASVDERAQNWPLLFAPGTLYRYANNDTLAAVKAIEETFATHPPMQLLAKLGMTNTVAETDAQGNYVLSSQVWSTARDLAKLGQLYLQDGVWEGERLLPEGWAKYVSTPSGPQPPRGMGYGAGWWTFARPEGNSFEGVPDDAFAARGNRGQYVVVVPSRDVVIVRRGEDMVGTRFDLAAFTRDVLAALEE